jgi:hypothetical protein
METPTTKQPLYIIPMMNYLNGQFVDLCRFQAEKFIFTVQVNEQRHKIFQVVFGKSDGSLYITFPYFFSQKGFLSVATFPMHIPVKSHTESGACRTARGRKSAVVGIVP